MNSRSLPLLLGLLLFLSLILSHQPSCRAQAIDEIRLGLLYHDLGTWGGSDREEGIDVNTELIFSPFVAVLGGTLRPNLGFSVNDSGGTSKLYGGGVWQYQWNNNYFVDVGLGITVHNGETDNDALPDKNQLGSPILFRLSFETGRVFKQHHLISIMFDHVSNAYLADPNEGLDTLGIRYGYRF